MPDTIRPYLLMHTTCQAFMDTDLTVVVQIVGLPDREFRLDDPTDARHIARQYSRAHRYIEDRCPWVPYGRVTTFLDVVMNMHDPD